ncbi:uncharacterized protein LOC142234973 isoform X2 [Haematobia irritans]|uniref:uncharacterized protein LOC142234973 isoform X2 n=1 Tax=Haematobia irritans TaxID=7368 RepID=UPI003F4FE43C
MSDETHKNLESKDETYASYNRRILIRSIRKRPRLYKNEFLRTPALHRNEKQKLWDEIAVEAKYSSADIAKCKWRSLISYLRTHLEHVVLKKERRYIPNTHNPEDRYTKLEHWL